MPNSKALVLFSGGLDSMLAVKVLQSQGVDVEAICFTSSFFNAESAKKSAETIGVKLNIIDISEKILNLVKNPPSGYGKNMNPCLDCHSMMIRIAQEKLGNNFDFIATGEVLGQRPFSQNKDSLGKVEKLSGVQVLRPLSAKLLPETEIEKNGLVIRGKLLSIQGRTREEQMRLAKKFNFAHYPTPAGGCLLTDPGFSERMIDLLDYWPESDLNDVEILKYGRAQWIKIKGQQNNHALLIIGRNSEENDMLETFAKKNDIIIKPIEIPGPTTLIRLKNSIIQVIPKNIIIDYSEEIKISVLKISEGKKLDEIIDTTIKLICSHMKKAFGQKIVFDIDIIA